MAYVQIPDDLFARYLALAEIDARPVEAVVTAQLARMQTFPTSQRVLVVSKDTLARLESLIGQGGGSLQTQAKLLQAVEAWAGLTLGHVRLDLRPAQLEEVAHRAEKQGKTPKQVVEDLVEQLLPLLFHETVPAR